MKKLKKYKSGGAIEPIYTDNPKDKRLQAYNDSLKIYNISEKIKKEFLSQTTTDDAFNYSMTHKFYRGTDPIQPIKWLNLINQGVLNGFPQYKKPVQPVILKKEVKVPVPKVDYLKNLPTEQDSKIDLNFPEQQAPNEDLVTKGNPIPDYLIQHVKTVNGMKTYKRKDRNSPWMEQYKYGGSPYKAIFGIGGGQSGGGGGKQGGFDVMGMFSGMMGGGGGGGQQQAAPAQQPQLTPEQIQEMELQKKEMMNQQLQYQQYQQQQTQLNYATMLQNYQEPDEIKRILEQLNQFAEYDMTGTGNDLQFNPYQTYQQNYNWSGMTTQANPYEQIPQNLNMQMDMNQAQPNIDANVNAAEGVMGGNEQAQKKGGMKGLKYAGLVDSLGTGLNQLGQASRPGEPDDRNQAWQAAKKQAAESNQYAAFFHGIDEGLQGIGKMAGGNKGQRGVQFFTDPIGFFAAMMNKAGEGEQERKKAEKYRLYLDRNTVPLATNRGQGKYGLKIKSSLIDEIYSDFDKYLNSK